MGHLDGVSVDDLHEALDAVEGKRPTQRLLAAVAYKNGVTQTELAAWHGVERRTIYNWLRRLDEGPLDRAARDDDRPGRPRKLDDDQREQLDRVLHESPARAGFDASTWTPRLVQRFVEEAFGVDYSAPSCRRLLREVGLRYRPPSRSAAADVETGRWTTE
jgi:transposase